MKFKLAGVVDDSIVDGPGMRLAVFFQGCRHACAGCHNPETHDEGGGTWGDTDEILKRLENNPLTAGITLTGGEPFLQDEAVAALAAGAHSLGKDVWAYTGYTFENLLEISHAVSDVDVLVDGPFLLTQRSLTLPYRGSANQRLIDVRASLKAGKAVEWKDGWMDF